MSDTHLLHIDNETVVILCWPSLNYVSITVFYSGLLMVRPFPCTERYSRAKQRIKLTNGWTSTSLSLLQ